MSLPQRARAKLAPEEWAYWYEGKPAERPLLDPHGDVCVRQGDRREGGSHLERMAGDAIAAVQRQIAMVGAPNTLRFAAEGWRDVGGMVSAQAGKATLNSTRADDKWTGTAAEAYRNTLPLPVRRSYRWLSASREWVVRRATAKPLGPRGTPRPQRGLERWCGKAIERGYVRPPRDLDRLHAALFERGAARPFATALPLAHAAARDDREDVAAAVRKMMGVA